MRIFVAGIMQGSHRSAVLHRQEYRARLCQILRNHFPSADIYDPLANNQNSLAYEETHARNVFYSHNRLCREVDLVVAFLPEASMGTAIEMWEAFQHGRQVWTISPLEHNWVVRFCSHAVFPDLDALEVALRSGLAPRKQGHSKRLTDESR